jgi:hypothetical protein
VGSSQASEVRADQLAEEVELNIAYYSIADAIYNYRLQGLG